MPKLAGVLETALYVDRIPAAKRFYENALGLTPMFSDERMVAYGVGRDVFLLFEHGSARGHRPRAYTPLRSFIIPANRSKR